MKWLFLVGGGAIAWSSLLAYLDLGKEYPGGWVVGLVVFLLVQRTELEPIILTNGGLDPVQIIQKIISGDAPRYAMAKPAVLAEATAWATLGYAVDFLLGLFVWPPIPTLELLSVGAVTFLDINWGNIFNIILCVFALQACMAQFIRRGGKLPFLNKAN